MGALTGPGLGKFVCSDLATCSLSDLGTADASDITSGTFGLARIPTMDDAHIPDLETLSYGGTFAEAQIPDLPTTKITSGTFGALRIPILPTDRYGSAVLVDGSRPMAGTLNIGNHVIDNARRYMFGGGHEVSLRSMGTYDLYIESKDALHWSNVWMGDLAANRAAFYGTVNVQGHPLTGVVSPIAGSHAANKSWVDAHNWEAGDITSGTFGLARIPSIDDTRIPDLDTLSYSAAFGTAQIPSLGAYKIASGTLNADRIPVLPTLRYGSAVLVDGSRSMENTFSLGSHQIDEVSKVMFTHDVAFKANADYVVYLQDKADTTWANLHLGWLDAHAGIYSYGTVDVNGHPLIDVPTPTSGSHAANKSYVDAQGGGIGTHGNEYHDPNMLPTAGGTHTGTLWMSNGALKDMLYIRSPSGNALALSYGLSSKLTIESDKVQIWDDLISAYNNQDKLGDSTHTWKEFHATDIHAYGTVDVHNHPIDDVKKIGFRDIHDVALITEGTYSVSVVNKAESLWGILETGHSYVHASLAWYIEDKTAGENLTAGNLVYLKTDGKWWKTDADAEATTKGLLGLAMDTKTAGQAVKVLIFGKVTNASWSWDSGEALYVSTAPGAISDGGPSGSGDQVRKIGHALSSTMIIFNPDATILEIA